MYHSAWNEKYAPHGAFVNAVMIFTSIKDALHAVTRPGTVSYSVRRDVLTQVLMKITPCRLVRGYGRYGGT